MDGTIIQFKRGASLTIPQLKVGEPAFTLDSERLYIGGVNGNVEIGGSSSGGGASAFTQLSDTPNSFFGEPYSILRVNTAESALEFADDGRIQSPIGVGGIPASPLDVFGGAYFRANVTYLGQPTYYGEATFFNRLWGASGGFRLEASQITTDEGTFTGARVFSDGINYISFQDIVEREWFGAQSCAVGYIPQWRFRTSGSFYEKTYHEGQINSASNIHVHNNGSIVLLSSASDIAPDAPLHIQKSGVVARFGDGVGRTQISFHTSSGNVSDILYNSGGILKFITRYNDTDDVWQLQTRDNSGNFAGNIIQANRSLSNVLIDGDLSVGGTGTPASTIDVIDGGMIVRKTTGGGGIELFKAESKNESGYFSVSDGATTGFLPSFVFKSGSINVGGAFNAQVDQDTYNSVRSAFMFSARNSAGNGALSNADLFQIANYTTIHLKVTNGGGVILGSPTGGGKGNGTLNVSGDIYKNNSAYNNPDYVLENYFTGGIEKFKDNEGARSYIRLSLEDVKKYAKENFSLPRISDARGMFDRGDKILEKIEELFIHLWEIDERLTLLESKAS